MKMLPAMNQHVAVVLEGSVDLLSTRVEEVGQDWIAIAPPAADGREISLPEGSRITLKWITPRGLGIAEGVVRGSADIGVPGIVVGLADEPEIVQRRQHVRADAFVRIAVMPDTPSSGKQPAIGTTLDLAGGGLRARVPSWIEQGEIVNVRLYIDDEQTVIAKARVVRRIDEETVALEFDEIPLGERERLVRYVFRKLRQALKVRDSY
jgi:c-di-GMP-binding flagellar brake protein YcgR